MNFGNNYVWIIILLLLSGNGCNGGNLFGGCGNDCTWLIILVLLFCSCGNGLNICDNKC